MNVIEAAARAMVEATCPGREGPFGGYDYGYGKPEPGVGPFVVRDFRDPSSPDWGKWVHETTDREVHENVLHDMTQNHIARAAVIAFLRAYEPSNDASITCQTGDPRDVLEFIADELEKQ